MDRQLRQLQAVVDQLSPRTVRGMLEGLESGQAVVTGAYALGPGSGCPLLLAFRSGSRRELIRTGFPEAWDNYCLGRLRLLRRSEQRAALQGELALLRRLLRARISPEGEQLAQREACPGCQRSLHLDYHGACACCGQPPAVAPGPVAAPPVLAPVPAPEPALLPA